MNSWGPFHANASARVKGVATKTRTIEKRKKREQVLNSRDSDNGALLDKYGGLKYMRATSNNGDGEMNGRVIREI